MVEVSSRLESPPRHLALVPIKPPQPSMHMGVRVSDHLKVTFEDLLMNLSDALVRIINAIRTV